jgi:uncharacterized HAD superfamily protein
VREGVKTTHKALRAGFNWGLLTAGFLTGTAATIAALSIVHLDGGFTAWTIGTATVAVTVAQYRRVCNEHEVACARAGYGVNQVEQAATQARAEVQRLEAQRVSANNAVTRAQETAEATHKTVKQLMKASDFQEKSAALKVLQEAFTAVEHELQESSDYAYIMETIMDTFSQNAEVLIDGMDPEDSIADIRKCVEIELTDKRLNDWMDQVEQLRTANENLRQSVTSALMRLHTQQ